MPRRGDLLVHVKTALALTAIAWLAPAKVQADPFILDLNSVALGWTHGQIVGGETVDLGGGLTVTITGGAVGNTLTQPATFNSSLRQGFVNGAGREFNSTLDADLIGPSSSMSPLPTGGGESATATWSTSGGGGNLANTSVVGNLLYIQNDSNSATESASGNDYYQAPNDWNPGSNEFGFIALSFNRDVRSIDFTTIDIENTENTSGLIFTDESIDSVDDLMTSTISGVDLVDVAADSAFPLQFGNNKANRIEGLTPFLADQLNPNQDYGIAEDTNFRGVAFLLRGSGAFGGPIAVSVPEPGSWTTALIICGFLCSRRRRKPTF